MKHRLEDHAACEAHYCARCKSTFTVAEINPLDENARPPCPYCRGAIASDDEESRELDEIRLTPASAHIEECALGEEE